MFLAKKIEKKTNLLLKELPTEKKSSLAETNTEDNVSLISKDI